jgi:hypothetical protein
MKRIGAPLCIILAAVVVSAPALAPTPAMAATGDRTVTLTLTCTNNTCQGHWSWYQGGTSGTLLASGSIDGSVNSTTTTTTTQPATADTVQVGLTCTPFGKGEVHSFTPGTPINIKLSIGVLPHAPARASPNSYGDTCPSSFSLKS